MPARLLREGILDSDAVNSLTASEEIFYRRLMSVVDDFGRFDARIPVLRSRLYALQLDRVSVEEVALWLDSCSRAGLVSVYDAEGKPYVIFHRLGQPRAKESKYPEPPAGIRCWRASAHGCAHVLSDVPYSYSDSYSGASSDSYSVARPTHENGHLPTRKTREPLGSAARVAEKKRARESGGNRRE